MLDQSPELCKVKWKVCIGINTNITNKHARSFTQTASDGRGKAQHGPAREPSACFSGGHRSNLNPFAACVFLQNKSWLKATSCLRRQQRQTTENRDAHLAARSTGAESSSRVRVYLKNTTQHPPRSLSVIPDESYEAMATCATSFTRNHQLTCSWSPTSAYVPETDFEQDMHSASTLSLGRRRLANSAVTDDHPLECAKFRVSVRESVLAR